MGVVACLLPMTQLRIVAKKTTCFGSSSLLVGSKFLVVVIICSVSVKEMKWHNCINSYVVTCDH